MPRPPVPVSPTAAPREASPPPDQKVRSGHPNLTERVAGWSIAHRKTAVFGWLLLIAALFTAGQAIGSKDLPAYDGGQSGVAERTLNQLEPSQYSSYSESVLIQAKTEGSTFANSPAMRQAAAQVATALAAQPKDATGIKTPLSPNSQSLISKDGRSALVTFTVPGNVKDVDSAVTTLQHAVAGVQAKHPDLRVAESGDASIGQAIDSSLNFGKAEATSVPITLLLLVLVFGALVAAGIPLLLALTALTGTIGLVTLLSHLLPIGSSSFEVVVIVGMAVGVDYSLFYLRREREERAAGRSSDEALRIAARTSGRTILISGLTVMATMAGLFIVGVGPFAGMAAGTIAVVGVAVVGSLTVLPGLLAWLGPKADKGRIPFPGRRQAAAGPSRIWGALARRVTARPLVWGGIAMIALLALAAPALGMRLGEPAADVPKSAPASITLSAIEKAFPQAPAPAEVVVTGTDVTGPKVLAAVDALRAKALESSAAPSSAIHTPVTATSIGHGRALIVDVPLAGNGANDASHTALTTLRTELLPQTLGKVPGISYAVSGDTASVVDDVGVLRGRLPYVFALVAVLAVVLLLMAFRSLLVSLVSVLLNLLSVGAAYGLVVLIFQDGRLQGPLDYTSFGGIIFWVPLMMFVFLFGISMDYHVFILSRIRERWARGAPPKEAVVGGIATSAGTVTSAALIMVAVFSIFTTMPLIDLKILGVGTAVAVLIDATVIRGILLPAALSLLGDRAWRWRAPKTERLLARR